MTTPTLSAEETDMLPLLCIGGKTSRMGLRKEHIRLPDGPLSVKHALVIIYNAVPGADKIYISLHNKSQMEDIEYLLGTPGTSLTQNLSSGAESADIHHHSFGFPALEPIFCLNKHGDIGPAADLLAVHTAHPNATLLVLGYDYPLITAAALQQLILEYEPPLTCFVNEDGFPEPLIAIWSPEALNALDTEVKEGWSSLNRTFDMLNGKKVKPLRYIWITKCNTEDKWEIALKMLQDGEQ